jgi:hypothetical protein
MTRNNLHTSSMSTTSTTTTHSPSPASVLFSAAKFTTFCAFTNRRPTVAAPRETWCNNNTYQEQEEVRNAWKTRDPCYCTAFSRKNAEKRHQQARRTIHTSHQPIQHNTLQATNQYTRFITNLHKSAVILVCASRRLWGVLWASRSIDKTTPGAHTTRTASW